MQIINLPNHFLLIRQVHKRPFSASLEFYAYKYRNENDNLHQHTHTHLLASIIPVEEKGGGSIR